MAKKTEEHKGLYIGVVKDNRDPDKLGSLKVLIPTVTDNIALDDLPWAIYCDPFGGYKDQGFFFIPAVGAEVFIMFADGDVSQPVWVGCRNKKKDNPGPREATTEADDEHYYYRKQIKTEVGYIMFDDKEDYIEIVHKNGSFIILDTLGDVSIRAYRNVNIKAGKNVNISAENGSFSVEALYSSKLEAKDGDFAIESIDGSIAITSFAKSVYLAAEEDIKSMAHRDIEDYAHRQRITTSATDDTKINSGKNIEVYAKQQYKLRADHELFMESGQNTVTSSLRDLITYTAGNFQSTVGETGLFTFGKSTDFAVKSGDLKISTLDGQMHMHSEDDMVQDTNKEYKLTAQEDICEYTGKTMRIEAIDNFDILVYQNMNTRVFQDYNLEALMYIHEGGTLGVYISSPIIIDIHAGERIYEHTPINLTEESSVIHRVVDNQKIETFNYWGTQSITTYHKADSVYMIKAGLILLN